MRLRWTALLLVSLMATPAFAQFSKSDRMVGASVASMSYNSARTDGSVASVGVATAHTKNHDLLLNPSMGWFISENTAVGASLLVNPSGTTTHYETNGITFQKDRESGFNAGVGGFVRHYIRGNGDFLPFAQAGINGGLSWLESSGFFYGGSGVDAYKDTYAGKSSGGIFFNGTLLAGVTKKLSAHTGLDIYLGYQYSYSKHDYERTITTDRQIDGNIDEIRKSEVRTTHNNHGLVLGLGFQVFLSKTK